MRALRKALNEHARMLDGLDDRKIDRSELNKAINKLVEVVPCIFFLHRWLRGEPSPIPPSPPFFSCFFFRFLSPHRTWKI